MAVVSAGPVEVPALGETPKTAEGARVLYDDWAKSYDEALLSWDYPAPRRVAETLCSLGASANGQILDIGCGTGLSGEALAEAGLGKGPNGGVVGCDISEESLKLCIEKPCYSRAVYANLDQQLPFNDKEFDQ